jgi:hypothetical protein
MRDYNDRESQRENAPRWDADVKFIEVDKKPKRIRFVGPIQDIARHWVIIKADEHADKIQSLERKARKERKPFKRPKDPRGFPVLCPKFHLDREKFVDYIDPESGEGFLAKEVLSSAELKRHGIEVSSKSKNARYSKKSLEAHKAILLEAVHCAMHDDFGIRAEKKTWWHCIDRDAQKRGRDFVGVLGAGGLPITGYIQVDRIATGREMNPADPEHGCDLKVSRDKGLPAQQMWGVTSIMGEEKSPLTPAERKLCFGLYKLRDGRKINFLEIMKLRKEDPSALRKIKVIRPAAIMPIDEMAAPHINAKELKEAMVQQGYYHPDGTPREELKFVDDEESKNWDTKKKGKKDEDDEEEEEDGDNDEDNDFPPPKRKTPNRDRVNKKRRSDDGTSTSRTSKKKKKKRTSSLLEE